MSYVSTFAPGFALELVTPPACYPVSLAEIKAQLSIETEDYDARLAGLIAAATEDVEAYLGRVMISRTYRGFLDAWPRDRHHCTRRRVDLPRAPLVSVASIKTYDAAGVATTFDPANYLVDTKRFVGGVVLKSGAAWPCPLQEVNGIEITFAAGYGDTPGAVPEVFRLAVQVAVGAYNEQRGDAADPSPFPEAAERLLRKHRVPNV